jgi:rhodanese-related sulfurtransferase
MSLIKKTALTHLTPASSEDAIHHYSKKLAYETDCWDVHFSLESGLDEMVLLDVRSPELFAAGHVPGATNLPRQKLNEKTLAQYDKDRLFVVYCAGPHCNGADKAALELAKLGRPVKLMIGGVTGWLDEGFTLATSPA